jgi:hypothetical protein
MRTSARVTTQLTVREETLSLDGEELDRLLEALARLDQRDAGAIAEQIRALLLAGGVVRLTPTEAELAALELALVALAEDAPSFGPSLLRLADICADDDRVAEERPA